MADFGTLSSLGIASGTLKYDIIDQLKDADKDMLIKPLEEKVDFIKKQETALTQFITIGATLKSDVLDLADGTLFAKVKTDVNGSSVSVSANDGVKPQEFSINVKELAKNDIYESKGFASLDTIVASNNTTIEIGVGNVFTTINIDGGTTLEGLKDAINNANAGVTASIIDTGIGSEPYKLILKANDTGEENIIQFNYSNLEDLGLNATNYKSATFSSETDSVNNSGSTQTFSITVGNTKYSMDVADGMSVSDFINAINNGELKDSNGNSLKVDANFDNGQINLNIHAIGDIQIDDTLLETKFNDNTDFTNSNRLQEASNSLFTYNGVDVSRTTNEIDDLIPGVQIKLNSLGESQVSISNNIDSIIESIKKFTTDYNAMISNLQSLVDFNKDTGTVGLFQGDSNFTTIGNRLNNDIFGIVKSQTVTKYDRNGNEYQETNIFTAADIGFDLDKTGFISFDEEKFKSAYENNPSLVEELVTDIFTKVKTDLESIITSDNSNLNILSKFLQDQEKSYEDRIKAMNEFLDSKYEIMAKQFASYDEMINTYNAQSQAITMAIAEVLNTK